MGFWSRLFGGRQEASPALLPPASALEKARPQGNMLASPEEAAQAWRFDPQEILSASVQGYVEPPVGSLLGFSTLRSMARIPPIAAIIQTRLNQVAEFSRPAEGSYQPGYRLKLRDAGRSPSRAEQQAMQEMSTFFEHCGRYAKPTELFDRVPFEAFLRQFLRDSLELDQGAFEVIPDRLGRPAAFQAVDGSTIRRAKPDLSRPTTFDVRYVQVVESRVVAEWEPGRLCLAHRRPRTDLMVHAYGYSELEELARLVTAWLFGFDYNMALFRQGASVKGFMKAFGVTGIQFQNMVQSWKTNHAGLENAHTTPWFNIPDKSTSDLVWTPMQLTNKDMQFFEWLGWLYRLICADYQIDAVETGFQFGNEGQKTTLSEGSPADRIRSSLARGLHPLLRFAEYLFNVHLVWPLYPELAFAFVGQDGDTEAQRIELDAKRVRSTHTLNEVRAERDLEPLPWGNVILDPQAQAAKQAHEQPRTTGGGPGGWDEPGWDDEDPDDDDEDLDEVEDDEEPAVDEPRPKESPRAPLRRSLPRNAASSRRARPGRLIDLL
jgi:hypothetical protein